MAAHEIKQSLRKLSFPYCVKEALCRIGLLFKLRLDVELPCIRFIEFRLSLFVTCRNVVWKTREADGFTDGLDVRIRVWRN